MNQILLKLSYKGTHFSGFQIQKNAITVQGEIEKALEKILGEKTRLTGCSRTDAGVHALVYYATIQTEKRFDWKRMPLALNANLQDELSIISATPIQDDFHPRFDAIYKEYIYNIWISSERNPFLHQISYHYPRPFDVEKFCKLAPLFEGTYDFAGFMAKGSKVKDTVRTVYYCKAEENGGLLRLKIRGDGFLYNMVRIIVGTLLEASKQGGDEDIVRIIQSRDRNQAGPTAPPEGLLLSDVLYGKL